MITAVSLAQPGAYRQTQKSEHNKNNKSDVSFGMKIKMPSASTFSFIVSGLGTGDFISKINGFHLLDFNPRKGFLPWGLDLAITLAFAFLGTWLCSKTRPKSGN